MTDETRPLASSGTFDLTIAARMGVVRDEAARRGEVCNIGVVLTLWETEGVEGIYRGERSRRGKARAGHYIDVYR